MDEQRKLQWQSAFEKAARRGFAAAQRRYGNLMLTGRPRLCLHCCYMLLQGRSTQAGQVDSNSCVAPARCALRDISVDDLCRGSWTDSGQRGTATKCMRAKRRGIPPHQALLFCPVKFHSARKKVCFRGRFSTVSWPGSFPVCGCRFGGGAFQNSMILHCEHA